MLEFRSFGIRVGFGALAVLILVLMFLFQRIDWINLITGGRIHHPYSIFVINKTIRFLINDLSCLVLIKVIFSESRYTQLGWIIFWFELLIILPVYFIIKLSVEGETELSSPLLSQIHRLVVNPILMIVVIAAFYYQRLQEKSK